MFRLLLQAWSRQRQKNESFIEPAAASPHFITPDSLSLLCDKAAAAACRLGVLLLTSVFLSLLQRGGLPGEVETNGGILQVIDGQGGN